MLKLDRMGVNACEILMSKWEEYKCIFTFLLLDQKQNIFFAKKSYGKRDSQRQSRPVNWAVLTGECNKTARLRLLTIFNENDNTSYAIYLSLSYFLLRVCVFTQKLKRKEIKRINRYDNIRLWCG